MQAKRFEDSVLNRTASLTAIHLTKASEAACENSSPRSRTSCEPGKGYSFRYCPTESD